MHTALSGTRSPFSHLATLFLSITVTTILLVFLQDAYLGMYMKYIELYRCVYLHPSRDWRLYADLALSSVRNPWATRNAISSDYTELRLLSLIIRPHSLIVTVDRTTFMVGQGVRSVGGLASSCRRLYAGILVCQEEPDRTFISNPQA